MPVAARASVYLQLYPLPPRAGADLDDLAGKLDADGLRREHAPLALDEAMEEAGSRSVNRAPATRG
jgi:hypothetical protein